MFFWEIQCIAISAHMGVNTKERLLWIQAPDGFYIKPHPIRDLFWNETITKSILTHSNFFTRALVFPGFGVVFGAVTQCI